MRALVTGATGLIGRRLVRALDEVVVLSRSPAHASNAHGSVQAFTWRPLYEKPPAEAFEGIDVVFHLAGEPITEGCWTKSKKQAIRDSRIKGTRNLVKTLQSLKDKPKVLVSASAVGYYGDRGDEELTEESSPASTFLADVCRTWEAEACKARESGLRVVTARTGIVLAPEGGAFPFMLKLFRLGLGGQLGNGRQWMPWIHIDDVARLLLHAARTETLDGPVNVVSSSPVTNRLFTKIVSQVLHRPALLTIPRFLLQIGVREMSQVLLASQRVFPEVAMNTGYQFRYTELRQAIESCIEKD